MTERYPSGTGPSERVETTLRHDTDDEAALLATLERLPKRRRAGFVRGCLLRGFQGWQKDGQLNTVSVTVEGAGGAPAAAPAPTPAVQAAPPAPAAVTKPAGDAASRVGNLV